MGLKACLQQSISEPEFYDDLVYKFRKYMLALILALNFVKSFFDIREIWYNINVIRQTACMVVNPIKVDNFASLFGCTPAGRDSDSMTAPA